MISNKLKLFAQVAMEQGDIGLYHFFMQEWANYFGD